MSAQSLLSCPTFGTFYVYAYASINSLKWNPMSRVREPKKKKKNREKGEKSDAQNWKLKIEINWESQQWNKYRVINMLQKVKQLLFPSSPLSLPLSVCLRKQKSRRRRAVSSSGSGYGGRTWANNCLCIAWPNLPLRAATSACVSASASASASSKLSVQPFDSRFWDTQAQIWDTTRALHTYISL